MRWLWNSGGGRTRLGGLGRFVPAALAGVIGMLVWAALAGGTQPYETYESKVAEDSPAAQFRLSDASGSSKIADSVGSYTATNSGIKLAEEGPFGGSKSGSFASSAYAALPSSPLSSATAFTAEAWVYWNGGASYKQPIFDFGSSTTNYMYLTPASSLTSHQMLFEIRTSSKTFQVTATTLTSKAWEYIAVTETTGGVLTLYLNGGKVGETKSVTISPSSLGSVSKDWLGRSVVSGEPYYGGRLSNVAFYTKALSSERILAHYYGAEFPVNTVLPTISGPARDGSTLTAKPETWSGLTPITYEYQWTRCNTAGAECKNIESATSITYKAGHEDVGKTLRVAVKATNSAGNSSATSAQTAMVEALKPSNTALPAISGTAESGQLLTVSNGSWEGTPPISYTYQWEKCNSSGESCSSISGATASSYRVLNSQIGSTLRAVVTASNSAGSEKATSAATAAITAGPPVDIELPAKAKRCGSL